MLKYFILILFTTNLFANEVIKFQFEEHDYLQFECKAVLHDPECRKCRFTQWVSYEVNDPFCKPRIIERLEISPLRYQMF